MEVKRELRNIFLLLTLTYGSEKTLTWNRALQSRVYGVEISYLRGACGLTRWECESNESVYEKCGMGPCVNGVKCGVVELVKRNTLKRFGYIERKKSEEFVKKLYVSEIKEA